MITLKQAAAARGVSLRRLQTLCRWRRIPGARFIGRVWMVPPDFKVTPGHRGPKIRW